MPGADGPAAYASRSLRQRPRSLRKSVPHTTQRTTRQERLNKDDRVFHPLTLPSPQRGEGVRRSSLARISRRKAKAAPYGPLRGLPLAQISCLGTKPVNNVAGYRPPLARRSVSIRLICVSACRPCATHAIRARVRKKTAPWLSHGAVFRDTRKSGTMINVSTTVDGSLERIVPLAGIVLSTCVPGHESFAESGGIDYDPRQGLMVRYPKRPVTTTPSIQSAGRRPRR